MTEDAGAGVEIGTVDPGFVGTTKVVADSRAYTEGGAVRGRCTSVPHPRFLHSGMLEIMLSIVLYDDMMGCGTGLALCGG